MTYANQASNPNMYANWGQRAGGFIIDYLPPVILEVIGFVSRNAIVLLLFLLAALAVQIYNRWILGGRTGQTWGRKAVGIRLVSEATGQPIGAGMAFARDLCHFVDSIICYVGWLFPLWDAKRQTIADKIVSTVVVPA